MTRIDHPGFETPSVVGLYEALNGDGEEARIVGGAVRNALLGEPLTDIDFATTATPEETVRRAEAAGYRTVPVGIEHGTVLCVAEWGAANGDAHEVTTLREDVETDGRHAVVRFGRDWEADAARRDFTMNALYRDADGTLFDPLDGEGDARARRVRFIGDPVRRIEEDALRILRFYRFRAQYGDESGDGDGRGACVSRRDLLANLSGERLWGELAKLFVARHGPRETRRFLEDGLVEPWLGRVPSLDPSTAHRRMARLIDLRERSDRAKEPVLFWALLLEDDDLSVLADRLRFSKRERDALLYAGADAAELSPSPGVDSRWQLFEWGEDRFAAAALVAAASSDVDPSALLAQERPVFGLAGRDVIARGVPPGPAVGRVLETAHGLWREAGLPGGDHGAFLDAAIAHDSR